MDFGPESFRVLHSANLRQPAIGVIRQMTDERRAAEAIGIPWVSRLYAPPGTKGDVVVEASQNRSWKAFKREYFEWLLEEVKNYDLLLMRYSSHDLEQMRFARACSVPIVTMHHAVELRELEARSGLLNRMRSLVERTVGPMTLKAASGHAAITDSVAKEQRARTGDETRPVFRYSNGAFYTDDCVVAPKVTASVPELLFISSQFSPWVGLDLLLDAAAASSEDFVVHVAGNLLPEQQTALRSDTRFRNHGFIDTATMHGLLERVVVGLGAFGLHRKGVADSDTLKVREYLRAGLPTYAAYRDVFDDEFPYYVKGPADFERILAFARSMISVDRAKVSAAARPHIDKTIVVERMYNDLKSVFGKSAVRFARD